MRDAKSDLTTPRARHYGLWRAIVAFPMILGSLALIVMLSGGLGRWAAAVPLAWLLVAPVWLTRAGERAAVRLGLGYRSVRAGEWTVLEPVTSIAAERCRLGDDACDFYVRPRAHTVNAYAGGRRSIAVTAGLLTALGHGRLTRDHAVAMLSHEVLSVVHFADDGCTGNAGLEWTLGRHRDGLIGAVTAGGSVRWARARHSDGGLQAW